MQAKQNVTTNPAESKPSGLTQAELERAYCNLMDIAKHQEHITKHQEHMLLTLQQMVADLFSMKAEQAIGDFSKGRYSNETFN